MRDGWARWIEREAFRGIVPDSIRYRTSKGNLGVNFDRQLRGNEKERFLELLSSARTSLSNWINLETLDAFTSAFFNAKATNSQINDLWVVATLAAWQDQRRRATLV